MVCGLHEIDGMCVYVASVI